MFRRLGKGGRPLAIGAAATAFVLLMALFVVPAIAASVSLSNNVSPPSPNKYHVGDTITYDEQVTNTNLIDATMEVSFEYPDKSRTVLDPLRTWAPSESARYSATYVVTGAESSSPTTQGARITSILHADGQDAGDDVIAGTAHKGSLVLIPGISVAKTVDFNGDGAYHDSETYYAGAAAWKVVVTNTGNCELPNVTLTDTNGHSFGTVGPLAKGQSKTFDYTTTVIGDTVNTVTAVGVDSLGGAKGTVTAVDDATADVIAPGITVAKTVDFNGDGAYHDSETYYAGTASWQIVVTNSGDADLQSVIVNDSNGHVFAPIVALPAGASETFIYTSNEVADNINTAKATGTDPLGSPVTDSDDAAVCVIAPAIDLQKTVDFNGDGVFGESETYYAGPATWKLVVTNTGTSALTNVVIKDSAESFGPIASLAPGASETFTFVQNVPEDMENTAEATALDVLGNEVSDVDSADALVIAPAITVDKTVEYDGDGVYSNDETGYVDSTAKWKIVVTNSGDTALTNVTVSDSNGQSFGPIASLAAGASEEFTYETVPALSTAGLVTNTATATGTGPYGGSVTDDDSAIVRPLPHEVSLAIKKYVDFNRDGAFTDTTETAGSGIATWKIVVSNTGKATAEDVTVTDTNGSSYGPFDLAAGASWTQTYTTSVSVNTLNVATASGFNPIGQCVGPVSDAAEARVRYGTATRTPGFWSTHPIYAEHVLMSHLGGSMDLGWVKIDSVSELMGVFWARIPQDSYGRKRTPLCQAKVAASQQLAAAILNTGLENGAMVPKDPKTGLDIITALRNALTGTSRSEIIRIAGLVDTYNNSGPDTCIVDGDGADYTTKDDAMGKSLADTKIMDCK